MTIPRLRHFATALLALSSFAVSAQRFETLGLLAGVPVSIVHSEFQDEIRVISFRKATKREARLYFNQVED